MYVRHCFLVGQFQVAKRRSDCYWSVGNSTGRVVRGQKVCWYLASSYIVTIQECRRTNIQSAKVGLIIILTSLFTPPLFFNRELYKTEKRVSRHKHNFVLFFSKGSRMQYEVVSKKVVEYVVNILYNFDWRTSKTSYGSHTRTNLFFLCCYWNKADSFFLKSTS